MTSEIDSAGDSPLGRVLLLRRAAEAVLADLECPHRGSINGACSDCMNTGYAVTCQQEDDIVGASLAILRATQDIEADR